MRSFVVIFLLYNFVVATLCLAGTTTPPSQELLPVQLPNDEGTHNYPIEWWYYTGHLESTDKVSRKFAYEMVVFRAEPFNGLSGYVAHFALMDLDNKLHAPFQRINPFASQMPPSPTEHGFRFSFERGAWLVEGAQGHDRLKAKTNTHAIDLDLVEIKPAAIYGDRGIVDYKSAGKLAYYSRTRMSTHGVVKVADRRGQFSTYRVKGLSWMDHQWGGDAGNPAKVGWDWFSSHLSTGQDLMMFRVRNRDTNQIITQSGFIVGTDSRVTTIPNNLIAIEPLDAMTDAANYPLKWSLKARAPFAIDLVTTARFADQLFKVPGQITPVYWEGANSTRGKFLGKDVEGQGFTELVGYE